MYIIKNIKKFSSSYDFNPILIPFATLMHINQTLFDASAFSHYKRQMSIKNIFADNIQFALL